jgi:hypothetical protein
MFSIITFGHALNQISIIVLMNMFMFILIHNWLAWHLYSCDSNERRLFFLLIKKKSRCNEIFCLKNLSFVFYCFPMIINIGFSREKTKKKKIWISHWTLDLRKWSLKSNRIDNASSWFDCLINFVILLIKFDLFK